MSTEVYDVVVVNRHDLRVALYLVDLGIEDMDPPTVQALERLSNTIGYEPHMEGSWRDRVDE